MSRSNSKFNPRPLPVQWRAAVMKSREINAPDKVVLLRLGDLCDPTRNDEAWPGITAIAQDVGRPESCVKRSIDKLITAGLLERLTGSARTAPVGRRNNHYRLPSIERLSMIRNCGSLEAVKSAETRDDLPAAKSAENTAPSNTLDRSALQTIKNNPTCDDHAPSLREAHSELTERALVERYLACEPLGSVEPQSKQKSNSPIGKDAVEEWDSIPTKHAEMRETHNAARV